MSVVATRIMPMPERHTQHSNSVLFRANQRGRFSWLTYPGVTREWLATARDTARPVAHRCRNPIPLTHALSCDKYLFTGDSL